MRVKEPLNGFRKSQGHIIFHIALLIGSLVVLDINDSKPPAPGTCATSEVETAEEINILLQFIRGMHAFLICSHCLRLVMDSEENDLIVKLFRVLEIFIFLGTILYQQFYVLLYPPQKCEDIFVFLTKGWMMMELFVFYSMAINAAVFLGYIQLRGIFGYKDLEANRNRYKYDALDYYEIDIEWSSFVTVPIGLCVTGFLITTKIARNVE